MYNDQDRSFSKLAALRLALRRYPRSEWFWFLDQYALIMNPSIPLHTHFLSSSALTSLPLRDVPIFPVETSLRTPTLRTQPLSQISLILTVGGGIIHTGSMIIRRGDYAEFILDSWNDPLIRDYGFVGQVHQGLEHIISSHPVVTEGIAVMPKRSIMSFAVGSSDEEQYHEGDFVVHLDG
jgi:mannan polymerase II complex MNN11 subunit